MFFYILLFILYYGIITLFEQFCEDKFNIKIFDFLWWFSSHYDISIIAIPFLKMSLNTKVYV